MSRLLYSSARTNLLPGWFTHLDGRGLPRRAILVLGSAFVVWLYLLCLLSYLILTRSTGKRLIYGMFFLFLLATLLSVGLKILYPIAVFLLAWWASRVRERRHAQQFTEGRRKSESRA